MMRHRNSNASAPDRSGAGFRRRCELYRDPALWAWLVVVLLAMLPVKAAISG